MNEATPPEASASVQPEPTSGGTWLGLVGINEEGVVGLTVAAQQRIARAEHVFGGQRHLALADSLINGQRHPWGAPLESSLETLDSLKGQAVVVLASGDPFCYGIGSLLVRRFALAEMAVYPAPSAFSQGCARLGWSQQETTLVSLCGRPLASLQPVLARSRQMMVLCANAETPAQVAEYLKAAELGDTEMVLLEALGGHHERIRSTRADHFELDASQIHPLNMLALTLRSTPTDFPLAPGREREWFSHDGQISRAEVRALSMAKLAPTPGDRLWDIGAGSGAVAIEWLLLAPSLEAIAFERKPERSARICANAQVHGVADRLQVIDGDIADTLDDDRQPPDAIFVGGGARLDAMEMLMDRLAPAGRLLANGVTVETEALLLGLYARFGGSLSRIGIDHARPLGQGSGFQAARSITQWCWHKPHDRQRAGQ